MNMARNLIMNTDRSQHELEDRDENEIGVDSMQENNIQATHEYEMNQSESLTFLFNLLYDDDSHLSKSDVLKILNSLKRREEDLCFSVSSLNRNDLQGVLWPRGLKEKFKQDRIRIGRNNWFQNIPGSIEEAARVSICYSW